MNQTFEQTLIEHCAPTLAGIKPGSLFCFCAMDVSEIHQCVMDWDTLLKPFGVRMQILKERLERNACIIYVYRPVALCRQLRNPAICSFLKKNGYSNVGLDGMLQHLIERFEHDEEFPHEIGVFLGYPLCDVIGFIENHGKNFTCCGCWKSYSDPVVAQKRFDRYHACTSDYKEKYGNGIPIIQLIAAA